MRQDQCIMWMSCKRTSERMWDVEDDTDDTDCSEKLKSRENYLISETIQVLR